MKRIGKYTFTIGLLLIFIGFIYDIIFAGIPPQDPPLDIEHKYQQNARIASLIINSGLIITLIGLLIWCIDRLRQLVRKH